MRNDKTLQKSSLNKQYHENIFRNKNAPSEKVAHP